MSDCLCLKSYENICNEKQQANACNSSNYQSCRIPSVKGAGRVGKASTLTGGSTGAGNGSALDINGVVCAAT
jgi:hypothetical protein